MRVIKPGTVYVPPKFRRGSCPHCGCQIEVDEGDPEITEVHGFWHVKCPTPGCGKTIQMAPLR